jgi:hypothetical protein
LRGKPEVEGSKPSGPALMLNHLSSNKKANTR